MALSRIKTWVSEVLTSTDLNAEFNNILNNAISLISPLTGNLAVGGNDITGIDELALDNAGSDASAAGRIRRNAQALTWHDGNAARVISIVLDRDVTAAEVVSSVTETTVYTFSVPANTLLTNRAIRLTMIGDYLNNVGSQVFTVRVKYGATTIFSVASTLAANASRRAVVLNVTLSALNATNAQVAAGVLLIGAPNTIGGVGQTPTGHTTAIHATVAEDSTAAKNLVITYEHDGNSASISGKVHVVQTELL